MEKIVISQMTTLGAMTSKATNTQYKSAFEGLYWTVKHIKGHKCNLVEEVDPVARFVKSGWFVPARRSWKKFVTISEKNPVTKIHMKSTYNIRVENVRHLEKYYCMIHPFSEGRFYWDTIMSVIYIVQLESVPVLIIASEHLTAAPYHWFTFLIILNIFCAADIVISFFCGYYDEANQKIVLEASAVAKKYICSYFFFDLISVFQINHIAAYTGWFEQKGLYNVQWVFRFARIKTILNYSDEYRIRWNIPTYIFRTAAYINIWIIFFLWVLYLIIIVRYSDTDEPVDNSFHTIMFMVLEMVQTILLVRVPRSVSDEAWYKMLVYLLLLFVGLFLKMFIAAQILQIYTCRNISKNKYSHLMNQIAAYTRFKQVPHEVSNRIKSYIQFKFQKTVFKEKLILETISNSLRNEIVWHLCQNFITRVEIFKDMPPNVMMKIVMLLKQEIYLPNDVVVQTGELGTEMFFIYVGVLAVYTPTGKEICHLTDGDHFGEIALLLNETRVASCVAIDFCELYRLTKRDFNEALESYPAAKMRILQLGQDRFKQTEKIIHGTREEHSDGELED